MGEGEEERDEGEEVEDIARVQHAPAQGAVVVLDTQFLHQVVAPAHEHRQLAEVVEPVEQEEAGQRREGEGGNLAAGPGRRKNADSGKHTGQEEQADVGTGNGPRVHVADRGGQLIDRVVVQQGRHQGEKDQRHHGQILAAYDFPGAQRFGHQGLYGPVHALFGEGAHGQGGKEDEEQQRCVVEQGFEGSLAVLEQAGARKYEEEQP